MTTAIRFYTRGGNTKKLADAIAAELNLPALSVNEPLTEKVDVLFLGCSYYAFDMDAAVKEFLKNNREKISKVVCFGTSAMIKSMKKPLGKVLEPLNIPLAEEEFLCRGSFMGMHRNKPDESDLQAAKSFARGIVK